MSNKKKILIIIFIIFALCTLSITYLIYYKSKNTFKNSLNTLKEPFDYFTCSMKLSDIDPKIVNDYMNLNGKSSKCGPCEGATIKMNITTCKTDEKGNLSTSCSPNAIIKSSQGNPIIYNKSISPNNLNNFFCPK